MAQDTLLGFPAHTLPFRRGEFTTLLTVCAFGSIPGQDPKAAKYAVLTPGPGMFVNVRNAPRVVIAPHPKRPLFRRVSRCVRSFEQSRVLLPAFARESERGPFCRRLRQELFCRVVPIDGSRGWVFVTAFERALKSV